MTSVRLLFIFCFSLLVVGSLARRAACAKDCNACEAAVNTVGCWTSYKMRDGSCPEEVDSEDDRRFSFVRAPRGDRCYCCPA